jgi:hypothetical protein
MNNQPLFSTLGPLTNKLGGLILLGIFLVPWIAHAQSTQEQLSDTFRKQIAPWIEQNCTSCHNEENRESGIRVDNLDDSLPDSSIRLWQAILDQVSEGKMPPEDQPQPTPEQRRVFTQWLTDALHAAQTRPTPRNGSMRRLTVPQYNQTLKTLLGIDRNLTETLPPDALSRDGFTNQANTLAINPLQLETYFKIADEALDAALVDPNIPPSIEFFRMDLGKSIHPDPSSEQLILGANNHLLANSDFIVTEPDLNKPFPFERVRLQRKFRFIEGYQGNDTVRGWRDFEGIHHAVFACMRGNEGYPKGKAYELLPNGLALRSAIPSPEIFGESSTYGPQANFKLSLRELPERGNFQVRVTASKANDLLLIEPNANAWIPNTGPSASLAWDKKEGEPGGMKEMVIPQDGIYQIVVHHQQPQTTVADADSSKLGQGLLGHWTMNPDQNPPPSQQPLQLAGKATWVESPFDKALSTSGEPDALAEPQPTTLGVGVGDFTVSAWIHPKKLAQGGIVCLGGYGYTHGWLLDMPDARGILRIETANSNRQHNGTVQSPPGILKKDTWQHVCAVVRRSPQKTELLVNGYQVAVGAIQPADLSNPQSRLHIGRIENAQGFDGLIDEVWIYNRALDHAEVLALVEPGKSFVSPPEFPKENHELRLSMSNKENSEHIQATSLLTQPNFGIARLTRGAWNVELAYPGPVPIDRIELFRLDDSPNQLAQQWHERFSRYESRSPKLGVHIGLRRDCGSTLTQVDQPRVVKNNQPNVYVFEGDIANYPSPDVEPDNVNYLAGIREIGVRNEYTDGRDSPRLLIHRVEFEGPFIQQWPPESHREIFTERFETESDRDYATRVIAQFATRAFRRPLSESEKQELVSVFDSELASGNSLSKSIRETLLVALTSPQFLYITEKSLGPEPEPLDEWELASKLSYFLWNAPPDRELLSLAEKSKLRDSIDAQIDRLLNDSRSDAFAQQFVSEWMGLDKFDVVEIDAKRFPNLTRDARKHLRREPVEFFKHLLKSNAPVSDIIASEYLLANEVVANYYGLADKTESGFDFLPIRHSDQSLGGMLTQAAQLSGLSDGREANPVKRGAWFARKIIAEPPEDPPPNVPKLEDLTTLSLREKLQRHRDVRGCAQCHSGIDPWGLPFEHFDASGKARTDNTVDSATTLSNGVKLQDFHAFRAYLAQNRQDQIALSLAKHLATYACGRQLTYNETAWLKENIGQLKDSGYRVADIVRWIIHSDLYDKK